MTTCERCFACGRVLGRNPALATCEDEQDVFVGTECYTLIRKAGAEGFAPPRGGPRLYTLRHDPKGEMTDAEWYARVDRAHKSLRGNE